MVRGFATIRRESWFSTGAPVGYNHATVMGAKDPESTKAAGRILDVRTEKNSAGGLSLFGLIRWTDEARARVRAGEFDGFSIEAVHPSEARSKENGKPLGEWALVGGTLTNEPMISGMSPVAAAETRRRRTMDALSILRSTFALTDTATDAEVIAKAQNLIDTSAKVETLTEMLETVKFDRDSLQKDRDELLAWKTQKMLDRACDEGRIFASERDRYARYVAAHGEEEVNNHVFTLNRIKVMGEVGSSSPTSEINPAQGATAIETQIRASADVLVADGLSDAAAYGRAMIEVLSDPVLRALYESETTTRSN
jgi:phage I-like protein